MLDILEKHMVQLVRLLLLMIVIVMHNVMISITREHFCIVPITTTCHVHL